MSEGLSSSDSQSTIGVLEYISKPWSSMKDVPKSLKGAGLSLAQANRWSAFFDAGKSFAENPAGYAWYRFKQAYKKVDGKWKKKVKKSDDFVTWEKISEVLNSDERYTDELQDVAKEEIIRLAAEFIEEKDIQKEDTTISKARFGFVKVDSKEYIVGGVVYPSDGSFDSQGDRTSPEENWKALKKYMLKYSEDNKMIKISHKGEKKNIPIVESYFAEDDHFKGGYMPENRVMKGDWYMSLYLGDHKDIFELVEKGELTGFSMAGTAYGKEVE